MSVSRWPRCFRIEGIGSKERNQCAGSRLAWIDRWGTLAQVGGNWIAAQRLVDPRREYPPGPVGFPSGLLELNIGENADDLNLASSPVSSPVPEPSSLLLGALGMVGVDFTRRRR